MLKSSADVSYATADPESFAASLLSNPFKFALLLLIVALYYLFLLSNATFVLFAPEGLDQVFNNMLLHLLHGEFYVDPNVVGFEGFTHDGRTYSYFGVFPALLRVLAMPFADIARANLARLSCLAAIMLFVAFQLRMLAAVHDSLPRSARDPLFLAVMMIATILSGPQVYILGSASIYHESILWAAAIAAGFNLVVVRAAFGPGVLRGRELSLLAILAGLALLTRPSVGAALYLGAILLVAWPAWQRYVTARRGSAFLALWRSPAVAVPLALLGLMAALVGVVNFERWGNPFTFANFYDYIWFHQHPRFVAVLRNYGEFSLSRIWVGALYYATGIPYVLKSVPPFAEFLGARIAGIEAPPFTPLVTNPLTIILAGTGVLRLCRKPDLVTPGAAPILRLALLGHALAVLIIFSAMFFTMRYRFDLAPFMTLAALVGYRSISIAAADAPGPRRRYWRAAAIGLCVLGVVGSHYILLVHKVWSTWVPMPVRLTLFPYAPFAHAAFGQ